jgi:hypothetical protein
MSDTETTREATVEDAHALANALDRFFYDLRYTAPEAVPDRIAQLGRRITRTMTAIGYPKKGR